MRACGARLPGATLGVELAATPLDGCTAVAAKLKSVAGDPKLDGVVVRSDDGLVASACAVDAPASAVPGAAPGLVCTWSAVTGWNVTSMPLGWGVAGAPGML